MKMKNMSLRDSLAFYLYLFSNTTNPSIGGLYVGRSRCYNEISDLNFSHHFAILQKLIVANHKSTDLLF